MSGSNNSVNYSTTVAGGGQNIAPQDNPGYPPNWTQDWWWEQKGQKFFKFNFNFTGPDGLIIYGEGNDQFGNHDLGGNRGQGGVIVLEFKNDLAPILFIPSAGDIGPGAWLELIPAVQELFHPVQFSEDYYESNNYPGFYYRYDEPDLNLLFFPTWKTDANGVKKPYVIPVKEDNIEEFKKKHGL